jgi:hypothetical protein
VMNVGACVLRAVTIIVDLRCITYLRD